MSGRPPGGWRAAGDDLEAARVAELLGRPASAEFEVVVRDPSGGPAVIANAPFGADGTPMPTRYWLVDAALRDAVSRLEAAGGVRQAEGAVDAGELARAHARYAAERDALVAPGRPGPRPAGGVGGTRAGVKCLHAHLAWWLAGGEDPVGVWVAERVGVARPAPGAVPRWRPAGPGTPGTDRPGPARRRGATR